MSYQSRKRTYRSRRERTAHHGRNIRLVLMFVALGLLLLLILRFEEIWAWLSTYFY